MLNFYRSLEMIIKATIASILVDYNHLIAFITITNESNDHTYMVLPTLKMIVKASINSILINYNHLNAFITLTIKPVNV